MILACLDGGLFCIPALLLSLIFGGGLFFKHRRDKCRKAHCEDHK